MKNPFSSPPAARLLGAFRGAASRFPLPLGYAAALAVFLVHLGAIDFDPGNHETAYTATGYYLAAGFLLSLGLKLQSEERKRDKRTALAEIAAHTLLATHALHTAFAPAASPWETAVSYLSVGVFLCFFALLAPFSRERDDTAAWNFGLRGTALLAVALAIGHVMWGGLSLLLLSAGELFGLPVDGRCYYYIYVVCGELLSLTLFLGLLPRGAEKYDRQPLSWGFLARVTRYLFLPLVGGYLVLLYAYALRILLLWELPNGWCAWPVTILMGGCLGLEMLLYPVRRSEGRRFDERVARWLPLLIVPLLLLMTAGIGKRLSDYGLTVPRLYLLTLNIWFYALCIGLFLTRARRLRGVPASFALLFLLTSALPVNYTTLTRDHIARQVERTMEQTLPRGAQPPLDKAEYEAWLRSLPEEEARRMNDKLSYLHTGFSHEAIAPFIEDNVAYALYQYRPDAAPHGSYIRDASLGADAVILLPAGYTRLMSVSYLMTELPAQQMEAGRLAIPLGKGGEPGDTAYIPLNDLKQELEAGRLESAVPCSCNSRDAVFLLTRLFLNASDKDRTTVNISGYLLKR